MRIENYELLLMVMVSIKDDQAPLDSMTEENDDSLPELFSYLPDEGADEDDSMNDLGDSMQSLRSDGGKFNESSLTGFGLTWEETQALKKLASITKEMIDSENDAEEFDLSTNSFANKGHSKSILKSIPSMTTQNTGPLLSLNPLRLTVKPWV